MSKRRVDIIHTDYNIGTGIQTATFLGRPTVTLQMSRFSYPIKSELVFHLEWSILAVGTPLWHQYYSRSHHTQCPTHCSYRSPLSLHLERYFLQVGADRLCKVLFLKDAYIRSLQYIAAMLIYPEQHTFTPHTSISRVKTIMCQDWIARALQ